MDVLKLRATLGLDDSEYRDKLDKAGGVAQAAGKGVLSAVGAVAKGTAIAVGAAATGITMLAKQSISAYSETQQLIGGVETLFGAGGKSLQDFADEQGKTVDEVKSQYDSLIKSQTDVLNNANNAYKTAGLSANGYMETVTSFAASLTSSLGENAWQSAEYADQAITDMADNANKMGSSMESIQNAYQGFAKQNYTMLDNLKLGYGGTKEEMERLMRDAEKLEGYEVGSLDVSNFADVVEAIHIVQTELGITGTTADEASTTIQGSFGMLKSSWDNLVAGFADPNADIGQLIGNMVESGTTFLNNLVPTISQTLTAVGQAVGQIAPVITSELPGLINSFLPVLLESATSLVQSLADALPEIFQAIAGVIPKLLPKFIDACMTLLTALAEALPTMLESIISILPEIIDQIVKGIVELLPKLLEVGLQLIVTLANGIAQALPELIPTIVDVVLKIVDILTQPSNLAMVIDAALKIIIALANGLINALPKLIEKAPEIVQNIVTAIIDNAPKLIVAAGQLIVALVKGLVTNYPKVIKAGWEILGSIVSGIIEYFPKMSDTARKVISTFGDGIKSALSNAGQWGRDLIDSFVGGILGGIGKVTSAISNVAGTIRSRLHFSEPDEGELADFHTYAPDMMNLFIKGIKDNEGALKDTVEEAFDFKDLIMPDSDMTTGYIAKSNNGIVGGDTTVTLNIYGAQGQDVRELADIISERINATTNRQLVAVGMA